MLRKSKTNPTLKPSASPPPLPSPNISCATDYVFSNGATDDAFIEVIEAAPVVIDLTFNFPKNKAEAFIVIPKDKVQLSFWSEVDNFENMVPQISKEILSNFRYKYKQRATNNWCTDLSISWHIQQ